MIEREIERKIEDFRELGLPRYFERDGVVKTASNTISTVIGIRRAGKSYRLFQQADQMIRSGEIDSFLNICHMDFDNPILAGLKAEELSLIQSAFLKITPEINLKTPVLFLLDEIHKIDGWENYVIDLSRNPNWKVMVTGSSSKLLRHEIATELRGKSISTNLFPLSFKEFLKFKQFEAKIGSSKGQADIRRFFDEYLDWGSFPAVVTADSHVKESLLREYYDTMLLKDIIYRFNVSKPRQCIQLYSYLLSNIGRPFTQQSALRYLKSCGLSTSQNAVRNYIDWGVDSWLFSIIPIYSSSLKEQERNYKKLYAVDWALANMNSPSWDGKRSRAFENMVFLQLKRNHERVFYYLTGAKKQELDFIVCDNRGTPQMAVQVCLDLSRPDTLQREMEPLIASAKYFKTKENLIVTYNQERSFQENGVSIKAIPAWKWFLES